MDSRKRGGLGSVVASVFRGVDLARRLVVNALFLLVLLWLLVMVQDPAPLVPESAVLIVRPQGNIVEQLSGDPIARAVAVARDTEESETLLKDLLDAIDAAKDDDRIKAMLIDLNYMGGAGLSKLQELRQAIDAFKANGKTVIATSDFYGRSSYYLASTADEIYIHEYGVAFLEGYGVFNTYYKQAIDRLEVDWNVFRAGEFKTAVEPYVRQDMSDEAKEDHREWLGDLWRGYLEDVATARNQTVEALEDGIENFNEYLRNADGQAAEAALRLGLVDHVGARDAVRERLVALVGKDGEDEEDEPSFPQIDALDYLAALGSKRPRADHGGDAVAVIVASGDILDGRQVPGVVGGDSTAQLIRQARRDDQIKGLLLRIDSGGGSMFASEIIRHELELLREAGKPLVVSMSSVAASGGYWIAAEADEIWAEPTTLTGSIGIFAMFPTFQEPLERYLGMRVDGIGTNWLAGSLRVDRPLDPRLGEFLQSSLDHNYRNFLELVGGARGMTPEQVDEIARGRVWSGADAQQLGLVDQLGGFQEALAVTAVRAGFEETYSVRYLEQELEFGEQLMLDLLTRSASWIAPVARTARSSPMVDSLTRFLSEQGRKLARFNDPKGIYAHCQCEIDW